MAFSTILQVTDKGLCHGCGVCAAACPTNAIAMRLDHRHGLLRPRIDPARCTRCGRCAAVCPGAEVDFADLSLAFLNSGYPGNLEGSLRSCYFGHACDRDVRHEAASGGLVTALLIWLLDQGRIDGALVTNMSERRPLATVSSVARTPAQILAACGSMYCPTSIAEGLREVLSSRGRFAVVGLPCHIHGIRKLERIDSRLRDKVPFHFGLFCINNNTMLGTEYFLRKRGIDPGRVRSIRYRAKGWPGWIVVQLHDGTMHEFRRGTTERDPRKRQVLASAFHYDFQMPRCLLCADRMAELADISFADAWHKRFLGKCKIGKSLVVARTAEGEALLENARRAGLVDLEKIDLPTLRKSQNLTVKSVVGARLFLRRFLGRAVPAYRGKRFPASEWLFSLPSQQRYALSYVTHHRWIWPWLEALQALSRWLEWVLGFPFRATLSVKKFLGG